MKSKKSTYLLGIAVVIVWGLILYRIFDAAGGSDDSMEAAAPGAIKKEPYNDYTIPKDTTRLLLNYRDPFGLIITKEKDTSALPIKRTAHRDGPVTAPAAINWNFIQYCGYIRNPATKKLITLVSINGQNEMFSEGQEKENVRLIRNMHDSIKIGYKGKTKFITIKPAAL